MKKHSSSNLQIFYQFLSDCISFNSPKAIIFNLALILLLLAIIPTFYLERSPVTCIFKSTILPLVFHHNCPTEGFFADCNCPACGLTRAMSRLLHGDLQGALEYNLLIVPVSLTILFLLVTNLVKLRKN
jgi:hypothetical protein